MNKKFFSALLLGSLVMGGTFVSCSDYDDDIENLQGQIDKLAGKAELDSQVSSLSSQISAAQGAADAAKTAAAAAQAAADAAKGVADSKLDEAAVKAIAEAAAEGAAAAAQEGKDAAAVAQAAADAAQAAADAAQATADKGVSAAEAAQAAANAAAAAAQKTADKLAEYVTLSELKAAQEVAAAAAEAAKKAGLDAAKVAADAAAAAQKTADEAVAAAKKAAEDAAAAQKAGAAAAEAAAKAAEEAQKTADEAVAAAKKAQETADKVTAAQEAAGAAHAAADAAQKTADEAVAAAKKAAEEAAAAKKDGSAAAEALAQAAAAAQKTADEAVAAAKKAAEDAAAAQGAAAAAQATADAAQAAAEKVATDLAALEVRVKALEVAVKAAATQEALKTVSDKVAEIEKQLKDMAVLKTMVTEVSLIEAFNESWTNPNNQGFQLGYAGDALNLGFKAVTEQATVFGKGLPGEITFEAGKSNSLTTSNIVVRVNPANATIAKEDVQLIDSKGNVLDVIEVAGVKPYEGLITRTAANTGLWTISVKLKDNVTIEELEAATTTKINNVDRKICYAVAIGDETRSVVSTYDITAAPDPFEPSKDIDLWVSDKEGAWKDINNIRNRYNAAETGVATIKDEYRWYNKTPGKSEVPAIAENIVTANDVISNSNLYQNVTNRGNDGQTPDNRQSESILAVEVNKAIDLHVQWNAQNNGVANEIKGFYVTLDERNAVESHPSEINAWKSYEIENLNVVQPGNTGSITIKSGSANGDVIGFRIYAVNLDGTLLDPDGRAFYAYVGDATNVGTVPTQTIKAVKKIDSKSTANFLNDFKTAIAGVNDGTYSATGWTNEKFPVYKNAGGNVLNAGSIFKVYVTENGNTREVTSGSITSIDPSKVTKVWYQMPDAQDFVDGGTYTQKMVITKTVAGSPVVVKTITVSFTKVMPSEAPVVNYITGQTGELLLSPVSNPTSLDDYGVEEGAVATQASINLNNVFYELSRATAGTISFSVDNSAWKPAPTNAYVNSVTDTNGADETKLTITNSDNNAFKAITDGSAHTIKFKGFYPNISYYYDAENDIMKTDNFSTKESTDFAVTYNCWHKFTTWSWNKIKYKDYNSTTGTYTVDEDSEENTKTFAPELQWTTAGNPIEWGGEILKGKNDKNPEIFNATMADYIAKNVVKVAAASDVYLEDVVNPSQKNNYFTPTFVRATTTKAAVITFTKTQNSSNPVTNVKQVLKMKVTDVFGHEVTLTLGDVTILRQSN